MTKEIVLNNGKLALVDDDDFEKLSGFTWHMNSYGYAVRFIFDGKYVNKKDYECKRSKSVFMAREIMNPEIGMQVDHINHDKLDNRKCNLRIVTNTQNLMNRHSFRNNKSGYKGVCFDQGKWKATIGVNGKKLHLGCFLDILDAAKAYDEAAKKYFGVYSLTNF